MGLSLQYLQVIFVLIRTDSLRPVLSIILAIAEAVKCKHLRVAGVPAADQGLHVTLIA